MDTRPFALRRLARWLLPVVAAAVTAAVTATALGGAVPATAAPATAAIATGSAASTDGAKVTVMTRNLYLGGNLMPSIAAQTPAAFLSANAALLAHVDAMDFPARAELFAAEITRNAPDLVGLQEAALWRTGPLLDPAPATTVRYDYLALLLADLARSGHPYDVAVAANEADLEAPAGAPYNVDVRLTMRDVILVRHGGRVKVTGVSSGHYAVNLTFPLPAVGSTATSTRGWIEADVVHGDRPFRFVATHLEAYHAGIRYLQARELLAGPLAAPGDVIVVGDLNSGPDVAAPEDRLAYQALIAGGMVDTWPILHPGDPGYTSGLGDDLNLPVGALDSRIDMVLFRGALVPRNSYLVGDSARTPGGLWASDHLGHVVTLVLS